MAGSITPRRRWLALCSGWLGASAAAGAAPRKSGEPRFPGDPPEHRIAYQLNRADADDIEHILGSVGAMIALHGDNVAIAVVVFGPGIHLLARRPLRSIPAELRERAAAQAKDYGVQFIACGNTLHSLRWTAADLLDHARIEPVGAASLMERQEQGWAYLAW